jgi:hypothetical protein
VGGFDFPADPVVVGKSYDKPESAGKSIIPNSAK